MDAQRQDGRAAAMPCRKHPAHPAPVRRHNQPVIVLVTACIGDRTPILANQAVHEALRVAWNGTGDWVVGVYTIMPDHVHLFCAPGTPLPCTIKDWCAEWKRQATRRFPGLRRRWLSDCWDTQMRSQEHYWRKLEYVANNPVRWGLVQRPEDWPFRGKMVDLPWVL